MDRAVNTKGRAYSLAGSARLSPVRLLAGDRLFLPDAEPGHEGRACFRAQGETRRKSRGVTLPLAALLTLLALGCMLTLARGRNREMARLRDEQTRTLLSMADLESRRCDLDERLSKLGDEGYICYRAAQELGMKLALDSEVVWVQASFPGTDVRAQVPRPDAAEARALGMP